MKLTQKTHCSNGHNLSEVGILPCHGSTVCKACQYKAQAKYRATHYHVRRKHDLRRHGWTMEMHDAALSSQGNACAICTQPFPDTPCSDHDHETGKPRGLLCDPCNAAIGMLKDNPALCEAAAEYLRKHGK